MDEVWMTVLPGLQTWLSHIYQPRTLRPLDALASPSVSLNSGLYIERSLCKLNCGLPAHKHRWYLKLTKKFFIFAIIGE